MSAQPAAQAGVLCAGSIVQDTIIGPFEESRWGTTTFVDNMERHLGGNGANTARALAILGVPVRLLGTLGNDDAAEFALAELQKAGVDVARITRADEPNAATAVLVNARGERQFLHRLGASVEAFRAPIEFDSLLAGGMRHFHLASLFVLPQLRANAPEILRRAKAAGLSTSLDTNWDPRGEWLKVLEPCLRHVDTLFLNEDESRMLTGTADSARAATLLQSLGAKTVVQKLSSQGCSIYAASGEEAIRCPPYPAVAVDSTGAGDCFAAGFLGAVLRGESLAEAGDNGNAAGALSVGSRGAVAGLLPMGEFAAWRKAARAAGELQGTECV